MHFLILLIFALSMALFFTFTLYRSKASRGYLAMLLIVDIWLSIVLSYLLFSAVFD